MNIYCFSFFFGGEDELNYCTWLHDNSTAILLSCFSGPGYVPP